MSSCLKREGTFKHGCCFGRFSAIISLRSFSDKSTQCVTLFISSFIITCDLDGVHYKEYFIYLSEKCCQVFLYVLSSLQFHIKFSSIYLRLADSTYLEKTYADDEYFLSNPFTEFHETFSKLSNNLERRKTQANQSKYKVSTEPD